MTTNIIKKYKLLWWLITAMIIFLIAYKVIAQSATAPPIDFDNGPLVAKNQPSNIVLALSVEFPTSGGAYKDGSYVDGKEYIGYFNPKRCYTYPGYGTELRTAAFNANSDYFTPTGDTNSNFYCNVAGAGTGFSGNYLNYATMSAPDILRMALTGGDRGIDEQTRTVLDRGTIAPTGSAPFRRTLAAANAGSVTPFTNNQIIYAYNCNDQVIFTTNSGTGCANPNLNDATDLRPVIVASSNPTGTTTVTPTIAPIQQVGTTWTNTNILTSTVPTLGPADPVTRYTTTQALTSSAFSCPFSPCLTESSPSAVDTASKSYTLTGTATTAAPTAWTTISGLPIRTIQGYYWTGSTSTATPITAAESPAIVRGYVPNGTTTSTSAPIAAAEPTPIIRGYAWDNTTSTVVPIAAAEPVPVIRGYVWDNTTSTVTPISAAESTPVIRGYVWNNTTSTTAPIAAAESPAVIQGYYNWTDSGKISLDYQGSGAPNTTQSLTGSRYICFSSAAPRIIQAYYSTGSTSTTQAGSATNITKKYCTDRGWSHNDLGSTAARTVYKNYTGVAFYRSYDPFYRDYQPFYRDYVPYYTVYSPFYRVYAAFYNSYAPLYWSYTSYIRYWIYYEQAVWKNYSRTGKAVVKPRPLVCDATEGPTREVVYGTLTTDRYNFCTKYEYAGTVGYKPEGQVQQKSSLARLSVFSYLIDNASSRYGGVMRAPMKYVGPNKYDTDGNLVVNPEKEWEVTTGQFIARPITDATSAGFTNTGVINYLNRFGKTGNYKTFDNMGELWYEALRYLQGLAPTPESTTGITDAMKDGYPVYAASEWTDPLTSACQRSNFILGIGDTNTHWDKTIPGLTAAEQTAINPGQATGVPPDDFAYYNTPTIKGSATALNAHDWTKIVDGYERNGATARTYFDSLGRSRTTAGQNPAPNNVGLGNLDTASTGSNGRSSYHWAGLSYWANTQAIRTDIKDGASMDKVRVKTFMIDVDENNQGSVNSAIKNTSYYIAGKYGYFNDADQTGNPFYTAGQWADNDGTPKGHVLASQPVKLVAGIAKFFNSPDLGGNSFATVAVSSNSLSAASPNGQTFEPSFVPGEWSGTVKSVGLALNTATNTLVAATVTTWDAGEILTQGSRAVGAVAPPLVRPDQRNIITYISSGTPRGVSFTFAATNSGADLPASFNKIPYTSTVDDQAEARINYLRGDRTKELDETFRPRKSILGDIINSGPIYKAAANPKITGTDYPAFAAAQKNRTPMIYTGSNDGMLHAFKAETGQELFAYIPSGVLEKMPNLTSKNYIHQLLVDAVPAVDEVKTLSGWKTILASGMGGGAQGIFALDVTDPLNFNASKVMFEFTDADDALMGNVTSPPQFVKMLVPSSSPAAYKYYIVVSSGFNNYKNDGSGRYTLQPDQALFFLDVNKAIDTPWAEGNNYFKVVFPATDTTKANGMQQPGIRYGNAQEGVEFFTGDLQGNIWKASFQAGINTSKVNSAVRKNGSSVKTPLFSAKDSSSNIQPITSAPVIAPYLNGGNMIVFGTGRLLETVDRSTTATHSLYGIWDSGESNAASYNLTRASLTQLIFNTTTLTVTGLTSTFSTSSGAKRGWFFNLGQTKERVVIDPVTTNGVVEITSTIPPSSECTNNGNSYVYYLNPSTGLLITAVAGGDGYYGKGLIIDIDISTPTPGGSSYTDRNVTGGRTAKKKVAIVVPGSENRKITQYLEVVYLQTGRIYWREVKDFTSTSSATASY